MSLKFKQVSCANVEYDETKTKRVFTFREGDQWLWVSEGPTHVNTYEVLGPLTEADELKLRALEATDEQTGGLTDGQGRTNTDR